MSAPVEPPRTPTIEREEIARRLGSPGFLLVNVLSGRAFEQRRIPGSLSLPLEDIPARARQVLSDPSAEIAVYCASER